MVSKLHSWTDIELLNKMWKLTHYSNLKSNLRPLDICAAGPAGGIRAPARASTARQLSVVAAVGRVPAAVVDLIVLVLDGKVEAEHRAGGPAPAQVQGRAGEHLSVAQNPWNFLRNNFV